METPVRSVRTDLIFEVAEPATIVLHVSPATSAGQVIGGSLDVRLDGEPFIERHVVEADYGGVLHVLTPGAGDLRIEFSAELSVPAGAIAPSARPGSGELERLEMSRPSRYCPSDHVAGLAESEFGGYDAGGAQVAAITNWINTRISYVSGSTDIHDSAEHTLLTGQGVCRDFAHLGILLCRALDVPARFASVYAPGLDPMDFHAVFEAWHDDRWWVYDATRLAPRQSLVRIATGRDAADASFATVTSGLAQLIEMQVTATTPGDLPLDDHTDLVALP